VTFEEFLAAAWPWVWPSLALVVWVLAWALGPRRARTWINLRVNPEAYFGIEDRAVERMLRLLLLGSILLGIYAWILWAPTPEYVKTYVRDEFGTWIWATTVLIAFVGGGFYLTRRALIWLASQIGGALTWVDDAVVAAFYRPLYVTVLFLGIRMWAGLVPLPEVIYSYIERATETVIVVIIILLIDGLAQGWMIARTERSKVLQTSGVVLRSAVRIAIYAIGILMALSSLGLDVTPLIASLGVTSIAIGLALQNTLEDFLSGLLLAADQPVVVGDFVELESGDAGVILSIGWRTTRILTRDDMHIIVPNSRLAKSKIINRSRPREACRFQAYCGVAYSSDLDHVAKVALDVAQRLQLEDPRAIQTFKPSLLFLRFGESSVDFCVWLCATNWDDHFGLSDQFIRRLHRRFIDEHIVIPFPMRTLELAESSHLSISRTDGPPPPAAPTRPTEAAPKPEVTPFRPRRKTLVLPSPPEGSGEETP
jgi:small-conductance mechanosensitive channel